MKLELRKKRDKDNGWGRVKICKDTLAERICVNFPGPQQADIWSNIVLCVSVN
jgi:hypothetical protein